MGIIAEQQKRVMNSFDSLDANDNLEASSTRDEHIDSATLPTEDNVAVIPEDRGENLNETNRTEDHESYNDSDVDSLLDIPDLIERADIFSSDEEDDDEYLGMPPLIERFNADDSDDEFFDDYFPRWYFETRFDWLSRSEPTQNSVSDDDIIERKSDLSEAKTAMDAGNEMLFARNYKEANEKFASALCLLPPPEYDLRVQCHTASIAICFKLERHRDTLRHAQWARQIMLRSLGYYPCCLEMEICHQYTGLALLKLGLPQAANDYLKLALEAAESGGRYSNVPMYEQGISEIPPTKPEAYPVDDLPLELVGRILEFADVPSRLMFASCNKNCHQIMFETGHLRIWPVTKEPLSPSAFKRVYVADVAANDIVIQSCEGLGMYRWFVYTRRKTRRTFKARFKCENPLFYHFVDQFIKTQTIDSDSLKEIANKLLDGISVYFGRFVRKQAGQYHLLTRDQVCTYLTNYLDDYVKHWHDEKAVANEKESSSAELKPKKQKTSRKKKKKNVAHSRGSRLEQQQNQRALNNRARAHERRGLLRRR